LPISNLRELLAENLGFPLIYKPRQANRRVSKPVSDRIISSSKLEALQRRMEELDIKESDIQENFIKGSGSGGQKVNKTSSCVQLKHLPTGIEVKCQKTRSQHLNRYYARKELLETIEERLKGAQSKRAAAAAKIRRQKARRTRKSKNKMLADKRQRAETKQLRGRVKREE